MLAANGEFGSVELAGQARVHVLRDLAVANLDLARRHGSDLAIKKLAISWAV